MYVQSNVKTKTVTPSMVVLVLDINNLRKQGFEYSEIDQVLKLDELDLQFEDGRRYDVSYHTMRRTWAKRVLDFHTMLAC